MDVTLKLGDCLDVIREMGDKSVDCIVTDPPYGIKIGEMGFTNNRHGGVALRNDYKGQGGWDEKSIGQSELSEIFRIGKSQVIFGGQYIANLLPPHGCWIVWDKKVEDKYSNDFADCELAWTNSDKPSRMIRHLWHGMVQQDMKNKEKRYHPTQKPVPVIEKIIQMFTQEGDTVFDPFMGSGTTGVACVNLNRNFIGCEINPEYFNIAERRINNALAMQGKADLIIAPNVTMAPLPNFGI